MTDKERREDDALKNLIQAAYDFSDEQLLAELGETEATLSDSDFPGIEERAYQNLMARLAEKNAAEEKDKSANTAEESSKLLESTTEELPTITPASVPATEKGKVIRFGKKKVVVVGLLAAAFVGMLGVTAIGGKNYFFRDREKEIGIVFNNDNNIKYSGDLIDVYEEIERQIGIKPLKLKYLPRGMKFESAEITGKRALFVLEMDGNNIYFIQEKQTKEASVGVNSDRELKESIYNEWIYKDIFLEEESLLEEDNGYAIYVNIDNARYRFFGKISKEEIIKIAKNLSF